MSERYGDGYPPPGGDYGATTPLRGPGGRVPDTGPLSPERLPPGAFQQPTQASRPASPPPFTPPPFTPPQQQKPAGGKGKLPLPAWALASIGGAAALLLVAIVLFYFLREPAGFTIVIEGAPQGSAVFVDNVRRGIANADGTIQVPYMRPGRRFVRVALEGYEEFSRPVTGESGQVVKVDANLVSTTKPAAELPADIDYTGAMVLVSAGEFPMGSEAGDADERPVHNVTLPDFYIDKYEVTNAQYKKFCDATGHPYPLDPWWTKEVMRVEDYFNTQPELPVIGISYEDARAYAAWANKRLPTEEEWEKAASWGKGATAKRKFPFGDTFEPSRVTLQTNGPVPVTANPTGASAYGVFNMAGNVLEWTDSPYQAYPGAPDGAASFDPSKRVLRGGSFRASGPDPLRTTVRDPQPPTLQTRPEDVQTRGSVLTGIRTAVSADDPRLQQFLRGGAR